MGLVHRPAVVLCPPLPPDRGSPTWLGDLEDQLGRDGIPVVRVRHVDPGPGTGVPAGPPGDTPPAEGAGGAAADRLAVAGWVAEQVIAISAARLDRPLFLVGVGHATRGLPALGFAQRAARHSVVGYVMVDGPAPIPGPATADWPDAPVLYIRSPAAPPLGQATARSRGWRTTEGEPVATVLAHVRAWPDLLA